MFKVYQIARIAAARAFFIKTLKVQGNLIHNYSRARVITCTKLHRKVDSALV